MACDVNSHPLPCHVLFLPDSLCVVLDMVHEGRLISQQVSAAAAAAARPNVLLVLSCTVLLFYNVFSLVLGVALNEKCTRGN